jgi:hypothetical protein
VNWHQTVDQRLHRWLIMFNADPQNSTIDGYNATTREIQALIRTADQEDVSLRAHGGTWSFSPIAATDGILLNTQPLNYRFTIDPAMYAAPLPAGESLVFVQCGMAVSELNRFLGRNRCALQTCGASNGQTIAGAVSTGTHGAALRFGAMQDYVRALHLVISPDESIWLQPSTPVMTDALPLKLGARVVSDDRLFHAALVSFGSFGIIHGVLLNVTSTYFLQCWRESSKLSTVWAPTSSLAFSPLGLSGAGGREPDHFQVLLNPYDTKDGCIVTAMYRTATRPADSNPPVAGGWAQGDSAFEAVGLLTDMIPDASSMLASLLDKLAGSPMANVCGEPGQMFRDTTTRGKAAGAAIGVALPDAEAAIAIAKREILAIGAPALLAIRLVKSTQATLGFTRFAPATAVIDIDCPQSRRQRTLLPALWKALEDAGIPFTFHWGKLHDLDAQRVRRMYGSRVDEWLDARRAILPDAVMRQTFANDYTDRLGLSV